MGKPKRHNQPAGVPVPGFKDSMDFPEELFQTSTGWCFGTWLLFFHNMWDNPSHRLIFFKMVKTTI